MSCAALVLAAALSGAAPAPIANEPLFADIVARSEALEARARAGGDPGALKADVEALAALDMQGHVTLRDRGLDGDLKCILKGIAEDLPKKLDALLTAPDALKPMAAEELVALLDDNAQVVLQPPGPATPPAG